LESGLVCTWLNAVLATCSAGLGSAGSQPDRAILVTTLPPKSRIKNVSELVVDAIPDHARGKRIELWWQDEARIGQQGTLTRLWARRGSRLSAPRDCRYKWAYIFGAVCQAHDTGAALVLPYANIQSMNLHLAEVSRCVEAGAHAAVTLDGAGGHRIGDKLKVLDNISLLLLPLYGPR